MIGTVFMKLGLSFYNSRIAKRVKSSIIEGNALDSISDTIITSAAIISIALSRYTSVPMDGIVGVGTAVWIFIIACN